MALGLRQRIGSIRHAITLLGRQQMRRWLQLALVAADDERGIDNPLLDTAAVRATFMELLAHCLPADARAREVLEQAFLVGILSLIDALYDISMDDLVRSLRLSREATAALVSREGRLGEMLSFVESMERLDFDRAWVELGCLSITRHQALEAQWRAFNWRTGPT